MRSALQQAGFTIEHASHAGHAIARLMSQKQKGQEEQTTEHLKTIAGRRISPAYKAAFEAWQNYQQQAVTMQATTSGPLATGLGNASPYEVGLTLHHTYGVPYLPGSALKGLARRAALVSGLTEQDEAFRVLFGDTASAAHVIWWDGWMDPDTKPMLQLDTITVHHPKYYQGGKAWPTDFDDPTPVAFLSVPVGVKFYLALGGPAEWAHVAARLLAHGLEHLGLGGKTNAGYGGFKKIEIRRPPTPEEKEALKTAELDKAMEPWRKKIASINGRNLNGDGMRLISELDVQKEPMRRSTLEELRTQIRKFEKKHATLKKIGELLGEA